MSFGLFNRDGVVKLSQAIPCDSHGKPLKHWSGVTQAAKVIKHLSAHPMSDDESYNTADEAIAAYLEAQK